MRPKEDTVEQTPQLDTSKFIEELKASPLGKQIAREVAERGIGGREQLAEEIAAIAVESAAMHPKELDEIESARRALLAAEQEYLRRLNYHASLCKGKMAADASRRLRRDRLEDQLVKGASPLLDQFITWCLDESEETRKANRTSRVSKYMAEDVATNSPSVKVRCEALLAAINAAREMKLDPDQTDVAERIAAIKVSLPLLESVEFKLDRRPIFLEPGK
jgi:hypothetical protein